MPVPRLATVTPYVLSSAQHDFGVGTRAREHTDWGVDAKYGVTPSLTLDLTYNTDFAQVEVDEQRTNLTRFPLFFPEKRPFFLENAGVFSAGTPQAVDLFFTRRIGIDTLGRPVPILGGGRLSGRVGDFTVGALEIVTDEATGIQPANSFSVARVTRELGTRSRVGVLGVHRTALDESSGGIATPPTAPTRGSASARRGRSTPGRPVPRRPRAEATTSGSAAARITPPLPGAIRRGSCGSDLISIRKSGSSTGPAVTGSTSWRSCESCGTRA